MIATEIIAAGIGVGGIILGAVMSELLGIWRSHRERKFARLEDLRKRLEWLNEQLFEIEALTPHFVLAKTPEELVSKSVEYHAARILSCARLYFPTLIEPARKLHECALNFEMERAEEAMMEASSNRVAAGEFQEALHAMRTELERQWKAGDLHPKLKPTA